MTPIMRRYALQQNDSRRQKRDKTSADLSVPRERPRFLEVYPAARLGARARRRYRYDMLADSIDTATDLVEGSSHAMLTFLQHKHTRQLCRALHGNTSTVRFINSCCEARTACHSDGDMVC